MKKLLLISFLALLCAFNLASAKTTYSIELDIDIFRYEVDKLSEYQRKISLDLRNYYRELTDVGLNLEQFMQVAYVYSKDNTDSKNSLNLCSKKITSNDKYVQIFYTSNSNWDSSRHHYRVKSFNYLIEGDDAKKLSLLDICIPKEAMEKLLHKAFLNIKNYVDFYQEPAHYTDYEKFDEYKELFLRDPSFILSKDSIILVLPVPMSTVWHAVSELSYEEAKDFLNLSLIKKLELSEIIDMRDIYTQIYKRTTL